LELAYVGKLNPDHPFSMPWLEEAAERSAYFTNVAFIEGDPLSIVISIEQRPYRATTIVLVESILKSKNTKIFSQTFFDFDSINQLTITNPSFPRDLTLPRELASDFKKNQTITS
jgi:hypothetical protein